MLDKRAGGEMEKVIFTGTHRVRTPEQTLEIITPRLADYGITRLADVTGLDDLGVPVVMAVRPLAATLSVAQGKGATLELAKCIRS
jgi:ribosomal protein S12 methylthiotransferase accessory factor